MDAHVISWSNVHLYGDLWAKSHRLRHEAFIARQGWDVPAHEGMEWDQYDNPRASYIVVSDQGRCVGVCRLVQTIHPYMIEEVFPKLLPYPAPKRPEVWEATRFVVAADLPPACRDQALKRLIVGVQRFGIDHQVDHFLGLMPMAIWRRTLERNHVKLSIHCDTASRIDGVMTATAEIAVDLATIQALTNFVT